MDSHLEWSLVRGRCPVTATVQEISDSGGRRGEVERAPPPLPHTRMRAHTRVRRAGCLASGCQLCVFFNDVTFLRKRKVASGVIICFKSYMFIIYVLRISYVFLPSYFLRAQR